MDNDKKGIKDGKKEISEKIDIKEFLEVQREDAGLLMIPAAPKAFAEKHGLKLCWRSFQVVSSTGGYDPDGWVLFKRELLTKDPEFQKSATMDRVEFEFGGSSSPVYQRGDLILCYMIGTHWEKARAVESRTAVRASVNSKSAAELQQKVGTVIKITNID